MESVQLTAARPRLGAATLVALTTGMSLGNVGGNLMPVLLDGFSSRFQLSATMAGLVAAAQVFTMATVALLASGRAARRGRVRLVRSGLAVAAVGFLGAWAAPAVGVLLVANIVAGAGLGVVFAGASAALSATPDVDRATTFTVLFSTLSIAVLIVGVPLVNDVGGGTAGFALLAVCCAVGGVLVRGLPEVASDFDPVERRPLKVPFLIAVATFGVVEQGAWSYAAVLGRSDAGLSEAGAATILGVAAVAALAGVPCAAFARRAFGAAPALAAFMLLALAAKVTVVLSTDPVTFGVAAVLWQVCYLATLVLLLAAAGRRDLSGRLVAAAAGSLALGTGVGPAAIGALLDRWGVAGPAIGIAVLTLGALLPILGVVRARSD